MKTDLWVWIDPTRRCNLACDLCYTKSSHAKSDLELKTLSAILDKLHDPRVVLRQLHLNWRGEPLMNPRFPGLLRFALDRSTANLHWHTNGTLLLARSIEIVKATSRAHMVYVSIDGGNARTHDGNRGPGTFRKALNGLAALLKDSRDTPLRVGIYQLDFGLESNDYDAEFLELATQCAEWVRVKPVQKEATRGPSKVDRTEGSLGPCFWAGNSFSIDPTGDVSICLLSNSTNGVIGNILVDDLGVLLERTATWRARLSLNGRQAVEHCRSCTKSSGTSFPQDILPPAVRRQP